MSESSLTDRQLTIVMHLANGHTFQEIADEMYLSVSSVKQQANTARKRCEAKTLAHLVSIVISTGTLYWTPEGRSLEEPATVRGAGDG